MSIGYGDLIEFGEVGHAPKIDIRTGPRVDASQVVIPVLEGGFGGEKPRVDYPERP